MTWNQNKLIAFRRRFGASRSEFARVIGVDPRSVFRWESGTATPSGSSEAVLNGLREAIDDHPEDAERLIAFVLEAASVGGLAFILQKLLALHARKAPTTRNT